MRTAAGADGRAGAKVAGHRRRNRGLLIEQSLSTDLEAVGVDDLFDVCIDGTFAGRLGLAGNGEPSILLEATRRLGVRPQRSVLVEDADAGVTAGRDGGFALVIGVDRTGHTDEPLQCGADIVVADLADIAVRTGDKRISEIPNALESYGQLVPPRVDTRIGGGPGGHRKFGRLDAAPYRCPATTSSSNSWRACAIRMCHPVIVEGTGNSSTVRGRANLVPFFQGELMLPGVLGGDNKSGSVRLALPHDNNRVFDFYADSTVVYPGHGDNTTLGAERPHDEWRKRPW